MGLTFRLYSYIWLVVLILYSFGWSDFSGQLDINLFFFILITVTISLIIGFHYRKINAKKLKSPYKFTTLITCLVCLCFIANFIYSRQVPLFNVLRGGSSYVDNPGIPGLYPIVLTFSLYWFFYLVYCLLSFGGRYFIDAGLIFLCIFSVFSRSMLLFCVLGAAIEWFLLHKKIRHKVLWMCLGIVAAIVVVYMFGVLGNIRQGYAWNDCSYIEYLGKFHNWPKWLSKQFMWGYLYIITPLANLNYNVLNAHHVMEVDRFIVCFIPEFISQRLVPELITTSVNQTLLIETYFNAQTTYVETYYSLGLLGCYINYFAFIILFFIYNKLFKKTMPHSVIPTTVLCIFFVLSFFYNVFFYMLPTMLIIYGLIHMLLFFILKIPKKNKTESNSFVKNRTL